jgi:hypothetical protein
MKHASTEPCPKGTENLTNLDRFAECRFSLGTSIYPRVNAWLGQSIAI